MNKRNKFIVGYICGYTWHWLKPVRKAIIPAVKNGWQKASEKDRNESEQKIDAITATLYEDGSNFLKLNVADKSLVESLMRILADCVKEDGYFTENDLRNSLRLPTSYDGATQGWTSLDEVSIFRDVDSNWVIVFPKPESLVGL